MSTRQTVKLSETIGGKGRYQTFVLLICCHATIFSGLNSVMVELVAPSVTVHWNWDSHSPNRTTFESNNCTMEEIMNLNKTSNLSNANSRLVYETSYSRHTLTEDLTLICNRSWLVSFANTVCLFGQCLGNMFMGLTEIYGRRPFILALSMTTFGSCVCMLFSSHGYAILSVGTFIFRAANNQVARLLTFQAMEIIPFSYTQYIGTFLASMIALGQLLLGGASWLLKDWFYTMVFQTVLVATQVPAAWYILESPTWLAVRKKHEMARQVLLKISRRNGCSSQQTELKLDLWLEHMKVRCEIEGTVEKGGIADLFKNKRMTLFTCGLTYIQFSAYFIFYGLVVNVESFGSGLYLDLTASSALAIGTVLVTGLLLTRVSIRLMIAACFFLQTLFGILYPITYGSPIARTAVSVLARMVASPLMSLVFVYVAQVFPTSVRGVGTAFAGMLSLALATTSPFTKELGEKTSVYVPFILFAVISLLGGLVCKWLPETRGAVIAHTVDELSSNTRRKKSANTSVYTINTRL